MTIESFVSSLFLILLFGRILGELSNRLGWPSVIGEISAGMLIGPSLLNWVQPSDTLAVIAELGVILLLFGIGCHTSVKRLYAAGTQVFWIALIGMAAPVVLTGAATAYWLNLPMFTALFFGCALTATSIGISMRVQTLEQQQSPSGQLILGAAVVDDIIGVILLSIMFNFSLSGTLDMGLILKDTLLIITFLILTPVIARALIYLLRGIRPVATIDGYDAFVVMLLICLFSWFAHLVGAPALLGGFGVGIAMSRQFVSPLNRYLLNPFPFIRQLELSTKPLVDILSPVFFVYIGISLDLSQLDTSGSGLLLLLWLGFIAIASKLVAGLAAEGGLRNKLVIGSAMVPRGEVGLVFAELGHRIGVLDLKLFTELVVVIAITTFAGPIMLKHALTHQSRA